MAKVLAIILNYNSIEDSKKCATLLKKQQGAELFIAIVDNCSTDGRLEELEKFGKENNILVIANKENKGYSAGNNIGLKKAVKLGCQYAIIINPDVEIRDVDYVAKAIGKMEEDTRIVVLGTDVINMKGQHQNPLKKSNIWEDICWPLETLKNKLINSVSHTGDYKTSGPCYKVSGCCFFVRTNFIKDEGWLDENVFLYCEEPILSKRVQNANKIMYYMSDVTAYHMHKDEETKSKKNKMNTFFESRSYYLKEYSGYSWLVLKILLLSRKMQKALYRLRRGK